MLIIKTIIGIALSTITYCTALIAVDRPPRHEPVMQQTTDTTYWQYVGTRGVEDYLARYYPATTTTEPARPVYRHGDCTWLPPVALQAGWQTHEIAQVIHIALRESGCCPARAGGDIVDKNCVVIGHDGSDHRSDSGLMQINGVHWKQDHAQYHGTICRQMRICTQKPLFDALTNLRAARMLYLIAGWQPWQPQK